MRLAFLLVLAVAALVAFAGCGKSSPTEPADPAGSLLLQQQAEQALAAGDVATANARYKSALAKNPNNVQAAAGAAFTELFLTESDPAVTDVAQRLTPFLPVVPRPQASPSQARLGRVLGRFNVGAAGPYSLPGLAGGVSRFMLQAAGDPPLASEVQAVIRSAILPRLAYAEEKFLAIESHPEFVYRLPPAVTGLADTLEIDVGDVLLTDGLVRQIHAVLEVLVAYDWDAPPGAKVDSLFQTPNSEFATLNPDGAAQLAGAKANLLAAADRYSSGITSIGAETDDQGDDLIPRDALGAPGDVAQAQQDLQRFTGSLNGPVYVTFVNPAAQPDSERVYIGRLFVPAIADLKDKVPNHTFDPNTHDIVWTQPITFPDPTFNGILPDATNARLRFLWGL